MTQYGQSQLLERSCWQRIYFHVLPCYISERTGSLGWIKTVIPEFFMSWQIPGVKAQLLCAKGHCQCIDLGSEVSVEIWTTQVCREPIHQTSLICAAHVYSACCAQRCFTRKSRSTLFPTYILLHTSGCDLRFVSELSSAFPPVSQVSHVSCRHDRKRRLHLSTDGWASLFTWPINALCAVKKIRMDKFWNLAWTWIRPSTEHKRKHVSLFWVSGPSLLRKGQSPWRPHFGPSGKLQVKLWRANIWFD